MDEIHLYLYIDYADVEQRLHCRLVLFFPHVYVYMYYTVISLIISRLIGFIVTISSGFYIASKLVSLICNYELTLIKIINGVCLRPRGRSENFIKARFIIKLKKLNLWLTAPRGTTSVNQTSATDWQMAVRRDNVIALRSVKSNIVDFQGFQCFMKLTLYNDVVILSRRVITFLVFVNVHCLC